MMAEEPNNLMLEILRRLQADMADLKEGQRTTNVHLAAIESHMAGFHLTVSAHTDEPAGLRQRIERIERRLELTDASNP
jgi:predicted  nucleic acid-binding Zn-ribbon protein